MNGQELFNKLVKKYGEDAVLEVLEIGEGNFARMPERKSGESLADWQKNCQVAYRHLITSKALIIPGYGKISWEAGEVTSLAEKKAAELIEAAKSWRRKEDGSTARLKRAVDNLEDTILVNQGTHTWAYEWGGPGWYAPHGGLNGGDTVLIAAKGECEDWEIDGIARSRGRGTPRFYNSFKEFKSDVESTGTVIS